MLFFLLLLSLICIKLALWQIDRGTEKNSIYKTYTDNASRTPILQKKSKKNYDDFTPIKFNGVFINKKQFLLDNQVHNKKAGYDVLTPFSVSDKIILVNRGWVFNNNRINIPNIFIDKNLETISGYIYTYKKSFTLEEKGNDNQWPKIVQSVQIESWSKYFNKDLRPYILVMDKKQKHSFTIREKYLKNDKLKHYMYAGQWIIFSLIGLYLFIFLLRSTSWTEEE